MTKNPVTAWSSSLNQSHDQDCYVKDRNPALAKQTTSAQIDMFKKPKQYTASANLNQTYRLAQRDCNSETMLTGISTTCLLASPLPLTEGHRTRERKCFHLINRKDITNIFCLKKNINEINKPKFGRHVSQNMFITVSLSQSCSVLT